MMNLFEGPGSLQPSTLALRARKAGLPIQYNQEQGFYWLEVR